MSAGRRLSAAVAAVVVVISGSGGEAVGDTGPSPSWHLADIPTTKPTSVLRDVTAADATHAWAVGSEAYSPTEPYTTGEPMVLRWNGSEWSRAELPALTWKGSLRQVAAGSATDVWAVGGPMSHDIDDNVTVVLRYDGTAWREVPFPPGATPSIMQITDLSVVDGHAWLVGHRNSAPVVFEWTGQSWQEHQPPAECVQGGFLNFCNMTAIKAFAANDIWAAGNGAWNGFLGPLLYHWNGSAWQTVQVGLNGQRLALQAIDGRSSSEVWAVGDTLRQGGGTLAVRGDGKNWQVVSGLPSRLLSGVAVGVEPWVIGNTTAPSTVLSTHRSGAWADTPVPLPPGTVGTTFNAIAAVPGTDRFIAVGAADLPTSPRLLQAVVLEYA